MLIRETFFQGQTAYRIEAPDYTAIYHREGCGFAALFDRDGNDWIGYRPTGGEYGHYRGIPNMGMNAFGHPGYAFGAATTVVTTAADRIRLHSSSANGKWDVVWDIYPGRIVQTIQAVGAAYWWLYEGTPGGHFRPDVQYVLLPNGESWPCSRRYAAETSEVRTICFVDPHTRRGLQLTAHTPEPTVDLYWPMGGEGGMTVWGFGRHDDDQGPHARLNETPASFSIAFVEHVHRESGMGGNH